MVCGDVFYGVDDVAAPLDPPKDDVLAIEMGCALESNEKLGSICISSSVRHRQEMLLLVADFEVFIAEFASIDALTAGAIAFGEVPALSHEASNDPVEKTVLEV